MRATSIFLTGATGYLGAHVAVNLLQAGATDLHVLVRAGSQPEAEQRLWRAWQLHLGWPTFQGFLRTGVQIVCGDLEQDKFALDPGQYTQLVESTESVLHVAASLNRKSEKSCLNTNLRGTLEVLQLARRAHDQHGLRRFSHVSTVAVAGKRQDQLVQEDEAIEWERSDFDPYARTKKFCEHMIDKLLPDVPVTFFRPSIVLGDSRYPETTQFDMVRAFVWLAALPALPLRPEDRIDIVNADFVAQAISKLHLKERPLHRIYHLSAGQGAQTFRELTAALGRQPLYVPALAGAFRGAVDRASHFPAAVGKAASLLKVFLPYLYWNTLFDNQRVTGELGQSPVPFSQYCRGLLRFSREGRFRYPYQPWPAP